MREQVVITLRWYAKELAEQFLAADCMTRAGALTYTTLFAVVPMMTVAYAMFSVLPEFSGVVERTQEFIFDNFVPARSEMVQEKLLEFSDRARQLTVVGFVFLFGTAFLMLVNIEKAFNAIWKVPERRRGLPRFLLYWGVLTLGPPLIAGGLFISLYLFSLPLLVDYDRFGIGSLILRLLPSLFSMLGFTLLYFAVPNCQVPLFLAWLFLVWVLILSGAIFVRTLSLTPELQTGDVEPPLIKCARILGMLHAAHMAGRAVTDAEIRAEVQLSRAERDEIFQALDDFRLLRTSEEGKGWILGRNLKSLSLWDLYQRLPADLDLPRLSRVQGMRNVTEPLEALVQFGSNQMSMSLDQVFGGTP